MEFIVGKEKSVILSFIFLLNLFSPKLLILSLLMPKKYSPFWFVFLFFLTFIFLNKFLTSELSFKILFIFSFCFSSLIKYVTSREFFSGIFHRSLFSLFIIKSLKFIKYDLVLSILLVIILNRISIESFSQSILLLYYIMKLIYYYFLINSYNIILSLLKLKLESFNSMVELDVLSSILFNVFFLVKYNFINALFPKWFLIYLFASSNVALLTIQN